MDGKKEGRKSFGQKENETRWKYVYSHKEMKSTGNGICVSEYKRLSPLL